MTFFSNDDPRGLDTMLSFDNLFPEWGHLGQMTIFSPEEGVCDADLYTVVDLYCPNPGCECCKVTLAIYNPQDKPVATIAYGWKSVGFYRQWGADKTMAHLLSCGFLDPMGPQSQDSPMFLKALRDMIRKDPGFRRELKERYGLFKEAIKEYRGQLLFEAILAFEQGQKASSTRATGANVVNFSKHKRSS